MASLAIVKLNCIFLTVVVTTSQAIQWPRLGTTRVMYLFHKSCCFDIPMGNKQDNSVVRKILAAIRANHSRSEEEVETVTILECIGGVVSRL